MSTTILSPLVMQRFTDNNGNALAGGQLYTYTAGTSTPLTTFVDSTGVTANTNPVILNARGEANVWLSVGTTYKFSLFDASGSLIWSVDQVSGTALGVYVNVKDFGAVGNGSVDDTNSINQANSAATALGRTLFFPAGTYIVTQLNVLAGMKWLGESSKSTIIKYRTGTNGAVGTAMIMSATTSSADDAWIEGFTLDGNKAGNTTGDTLVYRGARPILKDINVINSAGNAVQTDWAGPSFRSTGFEGHFSHITIDSPNKSAWLHRGPSDSFFSNVIIIDPGQAADNSYYGMYLDPAGSGSNGRFFDLHAWNRSNVTNRAIAGVYVGFGGNTFDGCHFEGSLLPLNVASGLNSFSNCHYYAPRGAYAVNVSGGTNSLSGVLGDTFYTGNPNYIGINLTGPSNRIDIVVASTIVGIAFGDSAAGGNMVNVTGFLGAGGAAYSGTPAANDVINILVQGAGGGTLVQGVAPLAATSYGGTITPSSGAFNNASITASYYYQVGKIIYFDVYYNIVTVGTATGFLQISLPFVATSNALGSGVGDNGAPSIMEGHFTSASQNFMSFINYNGVSACLTTGYGHVGGWYITN